MATSTEPGGVPDNLEAWELDEIRDRAEWGRFVAPSQVVRLLAALAASREEVRRLRAAIDFDRAEFVAQCFHGFYERLAPEFGYATREESAVPWSQVPSPNRELMITVAGHVLREIEDLAMPAAMRSPESPPAEDAS